MNQLTNNMGGACEPWWGGKSGDLYLCAPIYPFASIVEVLGRVRSKNDGRSEWTFIQPRQFFTCQKPPEVTQGVCPSEAQAKRMVESFWGLGE